FAFLLGRRLAELHRALARAGTRAGAAGFGAGPAAADLLPEPFGLLHQHALYHAIRGRLRRALAHPARLAAALAGVEGGARALAAAQAALPERLARLRGLTAGKIDGERLRLHGDPRLDRILF